MEVIYVQAESVIGAAPRARPALERRCTTDSNSTRPSALPSDRARTPARGAASGRRRCARSLQMPAMLATEPFGLAASVELRRRASRSGR